MVYEFIEVRESKSIATLTLNRPNKRNAMHGPMIAEITEAIEKLSQSSIRILLINARGDNFCAGGDIAWMQKIAATGSANLSDAQALSNLLFKIYSFPKPTIALAQGASLGGGFGILSAADIAVAAKNAIFGLPEVKIGLTPSMISPYVISAIGERAAHYYFLTGERFGTDEAYRLGLIHKIAEIDNLQEVGLNVAKHLLENSPKALYEAKLLIRQSAKVKITQDTANKTAEHLANLRTTSEAQEGLMAFLEKRPAKWSE